MKKFASSLGLLLVLVLVLTMGLSMLPVAAQGDSELVAVRVENPSMDPFASFWGDAQTLTVTLDPQNEEAVDPVTDVNLQAVYTDDMLYVRAVWMDNTMNSVRRTWFFDGEAWVRGGIPNANNEDRLSFMFDITGNAQFNALGCGSTCHTGGEVDYMGFPVDSTDAVDMWQWKGSRTAAAGYADDQWAGAFVDNEEEPTGRASDSKDSGGYANNVNEAGDGPAFMYPEGVTNGPLFAADAVEIGDTAFEAGATIPYYLMARPVGSRGDVDAMSYYVQGLDGNSYWYVVLARALDTGNADDHVFTLGSSNVFGVAVFNDAGGNKHATHGDLLTLVIGE